MHNVKASIIRGFFYSIISKMKIAIQGIQGSFHHIVANHYFGENIILKECLSFTEIPELLNEEVVDGAVMAIENSLAGSILPNYKIGPAICQNRQKNFQKHRASNKKSDRYQK